MTRLIIIMKVALLPPAVLLTLVILQVSGVVPNGIRNNNVVGGSVFQSQSQLDSQCRSHQNCSQCIQTLGCMWCKDKNMPLESRCFSNQSLSNCADIENPQGSVKGIPEPNGEIKGNGNGSHKLSPQVVELRLRKGEKLNVTLKYTDEKNRPLDLYIVMDLSCSMKKHKDKVADLASTLALNLKNLTSDLTIGFGSFVDKPLAPFGFLVPPAQSTAKKCEDEVVQSLPYGFKNHLKLTDNVTLFIDGVKSAGISSNIDYPEGTLDGLLQSIVCTKQIGWRMDPGIRKLVVISTDGSFHLAGDGKLVGVPLPHDGECYVDSSGIYTHDTILDYPTVSLVREKIREHDMFVIFAVTKDQQQVYTPLSQHFHPFAVTKGIDNEDNSIISVIQNEYKKLVNSVTLLSDYSQKDFVNLKFYAQCRPSETEFRESNQCNEVGPGVTVSFKIEVELKECPPKHESSLWNSNLKIHPISSKEDNMLIQLTMLCDCDCEAGNSIKPLPPTTAECSNQGFVQCGICACRDGFGGQFCNCTVENNGHIGRDKCVDPNTGSVCNNRGECDSCGKCTCNPANGNANAFSGEYCQCDNSDCPLEPGDEGLCNSEAEGGPHGKCECSRCVCKDEMGSPTQFSGSRCECPISNESCQDPKSSPKICNGIGSCQCGRCVCGPTNKGRFCEIEHARLDGSCDSARGETGKCVKCLVSRYSLRETDGAKTEHCEEDCEGIAIFFMERIDSLTIEEEENACKDFEIDENSCRVDYIIREKDINSRRIRLEIESGETVLREKCPTPAPILEIVIGIIAAMLLVGVGLLLLWKVVTHIQDKREYARFEQSTKDASWNTTVSPLYRSATSQFNNPAYVDYQENPLG